MLFIVVYSRRIAVFLICYIFIDFSPQELRGVVEQPATVAFSSFTLCYLIFYFSSTFLAVVDLKTAIVLCFFPSLLKCYFVNCL